LTPDTEISEKVRNQRSLGTFSETFNSDIDRGCFFCIILRVGGAKESVDRIEVFLKGKIWATIKVAPTRFARTPEGFGVLLKGRRT